MRSVDAGVTRRQFVRGCAAMGAGAAVSGLLGRFAMGQASKPAARPNIIFILADDLGFEGVGAYGGKTYKGLGAVKTPNVDALAAGGMKFKYCFACPVCSPTRSEFLTGKYNFRTGFIDIAGRNGAASSLDAAEHPTLAATLKAAGYVTAVCGKWHLGPGGKFPSPPDFSTNSKHVRECGFDHQCIFAGAHLENYGSPKPGEYTPDWFHNWALKFIEARKGKPEPFFLYYASPIPHEPLKPTPLNPDAKPADKELFCRVIEYLDKQVGEIVRKVEELGMKENTLIVFSGDNGTNRVATELADGKVVQGGKGTLKDTGAWVPLVASWPGTVPAGSVCDSLTDFTDIMPTFLELAGAQAPAGMDGVSFAEQLHGKAGKPREWVYVRYVKRYFVRDARWKLRENGELYDVTGSPFTETPVQAPRGEAAAAKTRLQAVLDKLHRQA